MRRARESLSDRLSVYGPKRVLVLTADGLRAAASMGLLTELERRVQRRAGRSTLPLEGYFDVFAGASLAALPAALFALGYRAARVSAILRELLPPKGASDDAPFDLAALDRVIDREIGDRALDHPDLRAGLVVPVKPADGPLRLIFHQPGAANAAPRIADVVRASIGAGKLSGERPIALDESAPIAFVDARLGAAADPGKLIMDLIGDRNRGLNWALGSDQVLVAWIGAGSFETQTAGGGPVFDLVNASRKQASDDLQSMAEGRLFPFPMMSLLRMDVQLGPEALAQIGLNFDQASRAKLLAPNPPDGETMARLYEIGLRQAQAMFAHATQKDMDLLPSRFDPGYFAKRPLGPPRTRLEALGRAFGAAIAEEY